MSTASSTIAKWTRTHHGTSTADGGGVRKKIQQEWIDMIKKMRQME